jgi:hypothetical protein
MHNTKHKRDEVDGPLDAQFWTRRGIGGLHDEGAILSIYEHSIDAERERA